MLKQASSHYEPDGRKGEGWYKWKPEYTGQICDDVDLLVVGGYYGFAYVHALIRLSLTSSARAIEGVL